MENYLDNLIESIIDNDEKNFLHYLDICYGDLEKDSTTYFSNALTVCLECDRSHFAKKLMEKDDTLRKNAGDCISQYIGQMMNDGCSFSISKKTISEIVSSFNISIPEDIVVFALETENMDIIEFLMSDIGYDSFHLLRIVDENDIPVSKFIKEITEPIKEPQ